MILTITMNPAIDKVYIIDNYKLGEVHRPIKTVASAGGKGLNVAKVAKTMGEKVAATGLLGGSNGDFINNKVKELGIESRFIKVSGETRICVNVSDTVNQISTEILEAGPVVSEYEVNKFIKVYEDMLDDIKVVTISGSLPKGISADFYKVLIDIAKKHNKKVILDTSSKAFIEGIKAIPYMVKPNTDEIKQVHSGDVSTLQGLVKAIKYFKRMGVEVPVISLGKDGCIAGLDEGIYRFTIPPARVINTVGSGDSFIAGCAIGLERESSQIDMIRMGMACGTANTQFAQTGYVEKELVDLYFSQVEVAEIG
ncbi:1-phosphofructokinase family hexose kinase [Vallitalea maricola]|uniref:1-phosphofructokinase n=1 Tax=Vallitalea maricola TaxID=3074433 RepID=A0ACB5UMV8_9FIRM|nr:1-phosphofructokinase [Vallitalea sp. AN17-2]